VENIAADFSFMAFPMPWYIYAIKAFFVEDSKFHQITHILMMRDRQIGIDINLVRRRHGINVLMRRDSQTNLLRRLALLEFQAADRPWVCNSPESM